MPDLTTLGLSFNLAIFAAAAVAVWLAGVRITSHAQAISRKTGIGQAVVGMVLLAGVTSLPELGVTVTASLSGEGALAVNNLFGSIALQAALLAAIDWAIGRRALTAAVPDSQVMLQGTLNVILLSFAAAGMAAGDAPFLGIGLWAWGCLFLYVASIWVLSLEEGRRPWLAARAGEVDRALIEEHETRQSAAAGPVDRELSGLAWRMAALGCVILVAGYLLAETGQAIASQTGLGSSFAGFVLIAFATSLPELSTAVTAARRGLFTMAISDILGTNLLNVGLIFVADLAGPGQPVLGTLDDFALLGALLGIAITGIFLAGMAERRDTRLGRMGLDSVAVAIVYAGGLVLLYAKR